MSLKKKPLSEWLWDSWCLLSIVGIWPRFIEPRLLQISHKDIPIVNLPKAFSDLKILHFSDLHLSGHTSKHLLKKIIKKIKSLKPDLIVFTGDFLCFSELNDPDRLESFLNEIPKAPLGNFAILGNHDYSNYVSVGEEGDYALSFKKEKKSPILKGLKRFFSPLKPNGQWKEDPSKVSCHDKLLETLRKSPFRLLNNETVQLFRLGSTLNLSGFGEYMMKQIDTDKAKENFYLESPGIALLHNPDGIKELNSFPSDLILSGHTHGGQVNLPFIKNNFIVMENSKYCKGYLKEGNKQIYITKGVGGVLPFRWFCLPEMALLTLKQG